MGRTDATNIGKEQLGQQAKGQRICGFGNSSLPLKMGAASLCALMSMHTERWCC